MAQEDMDNRLVAKEAGKALKAEERAADPNPGMPADDGVMQDTQPLYLNYAPPAWNQGRGARRIRSAHSTITALPVERSIRQTGAISGMRSRRKQ